jgi:hypothetical protein
MASPVEPGTLGIRPFINQYVSVLHENIFIKIDKNFKFATFDIDYIIHSETDGLKIPLLFYASEYYNGFEVSIDGKKIDLKQINELWSLYKDSDKEKFKDFNYLFNYDREEIADIKGEMKNGTFDVFAKNFLYFETDISKGQHTIKVTYKASRWGYQNSRLNEYSFLYALSPAKYWKSFGTLDVTVDATAFNQDITTSLGNPNEGDINGVSKYHFTEMPADNLVINFYPKVSKFTQILISLNAFGVTGIFALFFIVFHLFAMKKYRKTNPKKIISPVAIIGGLIIPFFFVIGMVASSLLIDYFIGKYASGRESYGSFFSFFLLPKFWLCYLGFVLVMDFVFKKIFKSKKVI